MFIYNLGLTFLYWEQRCVVHLFVFRHIPSILRSFLTGLPITDTIPTTYTLFKNGCHSEKNWRELHENEVLRASLGGIRIRKWTCWPYDIIAIFLRFQTRFLRLYAKQYRNNTGPYDFVFIQLTPVFSEWQPFLNKVYVVGMVSVIGSPVRNDRTWTDVALVQLLSHSGHLAKCPFRTLS